MVVCTILGTQCECANSKVVDPTYSRCVFGAADILIKQETLAIDFSITSLRLTDILLCSFEGGGERANRSAHFYNIASRYTASDIGKPLDWTGELDLRRHPWLRILATSRHVAKFSLGSFHSS
jgi:hypothetical protein